MKNILLSLNESEKKRIIEMHKNATKKHYILEQGGADFDKYVQVYLNGTQQGAFLTTYSTVSAEDVKEGRDYIGFQVLKRGTNGYEFKDNNQYYYQCVAEEGLPAGTVYDSDFKSKPDILADLKKGGSPFMNFFNAGCKASYDAAKGKQQAAAAQRLKKEAPNNPKLQGLIDAKTITLKDGRYFATCTPGQNLYLFNKDGKTKFPTMTCDLKTGGDKDITDFLVKQGYILPN
jgi:hypothetical protein